MGRLKTCVNCRYSNLHTGSESNLHAESTHCPGGALDRPAARPCRQFPCVRVHFHCPCPTESKILLRCSHYSAGKQQHSCKQQRSCLSRKLPLSAYIEQGSNLRLHSELQWPSESRAGSRRGRRRSRLVLSHVRIEACGIWRNGPDLCLKRWLELTLTRQVGVLDDANFGSDRLGLVPNIWKYGRRVSSVSVSVFTVPLQRAVSESRPCRDGRCGGVLHSLRKPRCVQ
eukprot:SAG22_NODE_452_length_10341_cov_12.146065_4_plen_228_part_00